MSGNHRLFSYSWLLVLAGVLLIVSHIFLFGWLRHTGAPVAIVGGMAAIAIGKHFGLFGSLYAFLRRRTRG